MLRQITWYLFAALFCLHLGAAAQQQASLPRSTPEAEGVSATAISAFLDSVAISKHELHSLMVVRHGKVIAEAWWQPYRADLKHTLYSLSKSFTATAVGFARAEGRLSLEDAVIRFFPGELPDSISANLRQMKVKDLLTMAVGHEFDPTFAISRDTNWVRRFLALPVKYAPGSRFLYNSMATYMLSAIVQKQTGQRLIDYLKPRLFDPLGITSADWETDPKGINTGGWGLRLQTEDIAKFAQLFLQKGKWKGRQVLPAGWVAEASAVHIIQHPEYPEERKATSDWEQGYGYQMWRCRNNAYRGDGAFGQYALILPEQDAVIAITSETPDMQGLLNLVWKLLLPAMQKNRLPANAVADAALRKQIAALRLPVKTDTTIDASLSGKTFEFEPNNLELRSLAFRFVGNDCEVAVQSPQQQYTLKFGQNKWQPGMALLQGPNLLGAARNSQAGLSPFRVAGEYTWLDAQTLELVTRYIESPHTQTWRCRFSGNQVSIEVKQSFAFNPQATAYTLKGKLR